jgi:hypothetical protein
MSVAALPIHSVHIFRVGAEGTDERAPARLNGTDIDLFAGCYIAAKVPAAIGRVDMTETMALGYHSGPLAGIRGQKVSFPAAIVPGSAD